VPLPRHIVVGPHRYQLVRDASVREPLGGDSGDCSIELLRIRVSPDLALSQERDTVLHETLHAVADMTGVTHELGSDTEEKFVRRLTPAVLDLLRRNPALVAYLTGKEA